MKFNPKTLSWSAPTENEDGTPIDYALNYELGVADGDVTEAVLTLPEELNAEGIYVAQIADMNFEPGTHTVRVRALSEEHEGRISKWSTSVTFAVGANPAAPFAVAVE